MATPQEFIDDIITSALAKSDELTAAATTNANRIIDEASGYYNKNVTLGAIPDPEAVEPEQWNPNDTTQTFDAYVYNLTDVLSDKLADFFVTYFPIDNDAFDDAIAWLKDVINNGGTGIPTAVEDAIWQRGRDRLVNEGKSVKRQIIAGGAAKGMPLVDGATASLTKEVDIKRLEETGQQSTQISAKQAEIEIETIKFAVKTAVDARMLAMQSAADYLRAIVGGIGTAVDVANLGADKRSQMLNAIANLYRARLTRDDLIINKTIAGKKIFFDWSAQDDKNYWSQVGSRVNAAASAADVFAKSAAAALAQLNGIASTATSAFS